MIAYDDSFLIWKIIVSVLCTTIYVWMYFLRDARRDDVSRNDAWHRAVRDHVRRCERRGSPLATFTCPICRQTVQLPNFGALPFEELQLKIGWHVKTCRDDR